LTALAILVHFDAAVDQATARIEQAQGTDRCSAELVRGIESWMDERFTQARSPPRPTIDL
jgi:hypothetical protein